MFDLISSSPSGVIPSVSSNTYFPSSTSVVSVISFIFSCIVIGAKTSSSSSDVLDCSGDAPKVASSADSILSGAISMESYIIWLINNNGLKEKFEEYKNGQSQVSFFQEVSFLKKNKVIDNEKAKKIKETFSKFKDYRNSIVHGDIESPFIERTAATDCIESLIQFYKIYENSQI